MSKKTIIKIINSKTPGKCLGLVLFLIPLSGQAEMELLEDWNINGTNTLRGSVYGADGPGVASPYADEGRSP